MTRKTVKVWACLGCWDKVPKTGQLKWQKLLISQLWSQKSEVKVSAGSVPSEPESEVSSSFSPSLGGFADHLWHVLTYRCFVPSSDSSSHEFALCMCLCSNFPIYKDSSHTGASLVTQVVKTLPASQETRVWFLGWENPLEKGMSMHCGILAWRIPRTEEPGGLQYTRSQRVGHSWAHTAVFHCTCGLHLYPFICQHVPLS